MSGQRSDEPCSGDTNPFISSELNQALERTKPGLHKQSVSTEDASGDTNPFTASELDTAHNGSIGVPTGPIHDDVQVAAHPATIRIILKASSNGLPLSVDVVPLGASGAAKSRGVVLDAASERQGRSSVKTLAVAQSGNDIGFAVQATPHIAGSQEGPDSAANLLLFRLYFDPARDGMVMLNLGRHPVAAKKLEDEADGGSTKPPVETTVAINVPARTIRVLEAGHWSLSTSSGQDVLDVFILPRRYVSVNEGSRHDRLQDTPTSSKRLLQSSQPMDVVVEAVSAAPPRPTQPPASSLVMTVQASCMATVLFHPLDQLGLGDVAIATGLDGVKYSLTRGENLMTNQNSKVFRAQYSELPGKLVVVKIVRTPALVPASDLSQRSAYKIINAADAWLKEFKIHAKLGHHSSVAHLHGGDGRFLSLYMENVEAPSLSSYRDESAGISNPFCTLNADDAARVLANMSAALFYIHKEGIVHNDIKPANILFSQARGAVLIDFGLSTEIADASVHTGGSPWYIPPEYIEEEGHRGTAGDVFALGVVMLFVLRKLPLPEMRQPRLHWIIADVRKPGVRADVARDSMRQWLQVVKLARRELSDDSSQLDLLVARMVLDDVIRRIKVDDLVDYLT